MANLSDEEFAKQANSKYAGMSDEDFAKSVAPPQQQEEPIGAWGALGKGLVHGALMGFDDQDFGLIKKLW